MNKLEKLKKITTKKELAQMLGVDASMLTFVLYKISPADKYTCFKIPKKNGGVREIFSPVEILKLLQSNLSILLLDCIDLINSDKREVNNRYKSTLSHGFVRERSIITNAMMHLNKNNVLNIDLKDFFNSFNFGRVRGFFIKNEHFLLDSHISTVIAQIACHDNKLPQGSPCSPVITNLIAHSLDIRLASLAKKNSCTYTRYADDMTFSSREKLFPEKIMRDEGGEYIAGKKLRSEINRAGFSINNKKTRIQYKNSRQDVTGLIVNKKPNVKNEYWRTVKAQCHYLFSMGSFLDEGVEGNLNKLEGRLNFIDQVDHYNRLRQKKPLNQAYQRSQASVDTSKLLSGRERTFSRFLYYRLFYANTKPTILTEGKTDNVYLKSAISRLVNEYPSLAKPKTVDEAYELFVNFLGYSKRTRFLLGLYGGTSYLNFFISKYNQHYDFYKTDEPTSPVIIVLDNDSGFDGILNKLNKLSGAEIHPKTLKHKDWRNADFIHVMHNLYVVLTPLDAGNQTAIEDLFDVKTRQTKLSGKSFNPSNEWDHKTEYGKDIFANEVIKANKDTVNFDGLKPLLDRIVLVQEHYKHI